MTAAIFVAIFVAICAGRCANVGFTAVPNPCSSANPTAGASTDAATIPRLSLAPTRHPRHRLCDGKLQRRVRSPMAPYNPAP
jgi:hypothetical protein